MFELNELLKNLGENGNIFSSFRSRQYLDQKERQTEINLNKIKFAFSSLGLNFQNSME